jgi:acetate kinase
MQVLVANLGSTSFKFKVLDMDKNGEVVARGGYERIGQESGEFQTHGDVIDVILKQLDRKPDAIGFKAVHGGPISGAVRVDDGVIATMEQFADIAPAHNPPYIAAMRAFAEKLPGVPQVACFETAFHQTIPAARQAYAVPLEWSEKARHSSLRLPRREPPLRRYADEELSPGAGASSTATSAAAAASARSTTARASRRAWA